MTPKKIKELREKHKLTQAQAANLIYASTRTWQSWEQGRRNMPPPKRDLFLLKLRRHKQ